MLVTTVSGSVSATAWPSQLIALRATMRIAVSERGRIPATVVEQYEAATGGG
jgi:hypothetical protein